MRNQFLGSILTVVFAAGVAARADTDDALTPIVVSATSIPTPQSQLASSITVVSADQIAAMQAQSLPDVLRNVPGLNLVQSGGMGSVTSIFVRGTNSNHAKVLVDGIDVSDPSTPTGVFDFGQFPTADIERIEVLRGPQSGLYGSDAIGGVINIITKRATGPTQLTASAEGGSFQTFNQTAGLRGASDQFNYSANVEHLHAAETPVTPLDLLAPGERRYDDYYDNLTVSTKLGFNASRDLDFGIVGRYTDTHLRFTGDDFSTFPALPSAQQSQTDTTAYYTRGFAHAQWFDGLLDQTIGVAYTRNRSANLSGGFETLNIGERLKVDAQQDWHLSQSQTLVLGGEHARDAISEPISAHITINSGYAELQSKFSQRLFSAINVRYDDNDRFGGKVTYRIAPTFVIPETGTRLKASVGTGFKAPSLSELFQSFPPSFFANPDLKPEKSVGYDIGVEQALLTDAIRTGVTYFHNRIRDLITTDVTGTTYANIGQATTLGVESFISYQPVKTLTVRVDYTYTQATDDVLHQELLRRPKQKIDLDAAWQAAGALSFDATLLYVGSWIDGNRDFSIPRLQAAGYTTVNLAGNYDLSRLFSVYARLNNLLDRHYENPVGFLQPSIGVFAGIKARL